jgi:hypothetical protein
LDGQRIAWSSVFDVGRRGDKKDQVLHQGSIHLGLKVEVREGLLIFGLVLGGISRIGSDAKSFKTF